MNRVQPIARILHALTNSFIEARGVNYFFVHQCILLAIYVIHLTTKDEKSHHSAPWVSWRLKSLTAIIGSDNGLSPGRHQTIIGTNVAILLIGHVGKNFNEILFDIPKFSYRNVNLKMYVIYKRPQFNSHVRVKGFRRAWYTTEELRCLLYVGSLTSAPDDSELKNDNHIFT